MRIFILSLSLVIMSCGELPEGEVGTNGTQGEAGEAGKSGENGKSGKDGKNIVGEAGVAGSDGLVFSVGLYDNDNIFLGYFLQSVGSVVAKKYEILTTDDLTAVIDTKTGTLKLPATKTAGCIYITNNCTGSCFAPDTDYNGLIVTAVGGNFFTPIDAVSESVDALSYSNEVGACVGVNTTFPTAVLSEAYNGILNSAVAPYKLKKEK